MKQNRNVPLRGIADSTKLESAPPANTKSMIERYSLKFTPAVGHKDLMKHFQEGNGFDEAQLVKLHQMKARIELLCDAADLKKIDEFLKQLSSN